MRKVLGALAATLVLVGGGFASPASADSADEVWTYVDTSVNGRYTPLVGYFDGNDTSDVLWYAPGPQADSLWLGRSGQRGSFLNVPVSVGGRFTPLVGNFAGDWRDDIIWYAPGAAADYLWVATSTSKRFTSRPVAVSGTYAPVVLRDLRSATSHDDVFWHRPSGPSVPIWHFADGSTSVSTPYTSSTVPVATGTTPVVGDWNVDGIDDVFLHGPGAVADTRMLSTTAGGFVRTAYTVGGSYRPVTVWGTRDETQPPYGDSILWWGDGLLPDAYWSNDGTRFVSKGLPVIDWSATVVPYAPGLDLVHVPEVDDFVFFEDALGPTFGWLSPSGQPSPEGIPLMGDFDGDGGPDIFWYVPGTAADEVWYLGGSGAGASARRSGASDARLTGWVEQVGVRRRPTR